MKKRVRIYVLIGPGCFDEKLNLPTLDTTPTTETMNALARTRYEVPATVILHRTSSQKELAQCLTSLRDHADGIVLSLGTEHDHSLKDSVQNLRSQGIPTILLQIGANKERSSLASLCSGEILAADVRGYVRGVQMAIEHATRVHN